MAASIRGIPAVQPISTQHEGGSPSGLQRAPMGSSGLQPAFSAESQSAAAGNYEIDPSSIAALAELKSTTR